MKKLTVKQLKLNKMVKKLTIFRKIPGTPLNEVLRTVNIHATFVGIGKNGQINSNEFKLLAEDLEPTSTGWSVIDI